MKKEKPKLKKESQEVLDSLNNLKGKDDNLPEFPSKDQKDSSPGTSEEEDASEETLQAIEIEEICRDVIAIPFEVWHTLKPSVPPLTPKEKERIGKPLARVVVKYDVARYMKDEFLLLGFLGFAVLQRTRVKDKPKGDKTEETTGR